MKLYFLIKSKDTIKLIKIKKFYEFHDPLLDKARVTDPLRVSRDSKYGPGSLVIHSTFQCLIDYA